MFQDVSDSMSAVIDIDDLLTRCLGNREFAEHILDVFHQRCAEDLEELDSAVRAEDLASIERIAHRLQGACANAAARGLKERASLLRKAACENSLEGASLYLEALQTEWSHFVAALGSTGITPGAGSAP